MRLRILILVSLVAFSLEIFPQVSTTVQKKSILLEEFTGIHCGNCPQGHEIARNLLNANENAFAIAIHSGYFAIPVGGEPDFRIPEGEMIDNEFKVGTLFGYPSAATNRHPFEGEYITFRGDWIKNAKAIHAEDAPVNILSTTIFDGNTRKLSVKVEIYYTLEVTETAHWLNIVVTENDITGPQSGIGGGEFYIHNHILRSFITPMNINAWGEKIVAPAQGKHFEFEYEYDLPAKINNVPIKPENIEIIAFVCADKTEVLNVSGGKPIYNNFEKPLNATLLKPAREIGARYAFNFFEAQLRNLSNKTITSAMLEVTINGEMQNVEWTGEIPAFATKPMVIPTESYLINASNTYHIKLIKINNEPIAGNAISGSFNEPIETTKKIRIEIKTDMYADENRFLMKDREGNIVQEFGPYEPNVVAVYNETITLDKNKTYCFEVIDEWWDGIQAPRGYLKMHNENGDLIMQAYDIRLFGERVFIHTSKELSMDEPVPQEIRAFYNDLRQTIEVSFSAATSGAVVISLYTVTGALLVEKIVQAAKEENCEIALPASKYSKGIYVLKIDQGTQSIARKFVIH